ncbi:MAG: hypothetical protein ABH859_03860 [Pseudomonadota bacterium]
MSIQLILSLIALILTIGAAFNSDSLRVALPLLGVAGVLLLTPFFLKENKQQKFRQLIIISSFLLIAAINLIIIRADVFFNYNPDSLRLAEFKAEIKVLMPKEGLQIISFLDNKKKAENLHQYFQEISKNIYYANYDPAIFPDQARKYGVTQYGTAVVVYQGRQIKLERLDLRTIFAAINLVLEKYQGTEVCFLTSQSKFDPYKSGLEGGAEAAKLLDENGLSWSAIKLTRITKDRLAKCNVLILTIENPVLTDEEKQAIQEYILAGDRGLFLMLEDQALEPSIQSWLEKMLPMQVTSIKIRQNKDAAIPFSAGIILADQMGYLAQKSLEPILLKEPFIIENNNKAGWEIEDLATIAGETREFIDLNKGIVDLDQPYSVVSKLFKGTNGERAIVIGDAKWATDSYINRAGNATFFLNGILWLLQEQQGDKRAAFASYVPPASEIVDISDEELIWLKRVFVFILPGFLFAILFIVWRRL